MNLLKYALIIPLLLSSCSGNKEPKTKISQDVGEEFISKNSTTNSEKLRDNWWLDFNDSTLNELIKIGLENNKDVEISSLAITTSRQLNNVDLAKLLPSASVGISRQRFSSPGFGPSGVSYDLFQATFDAAWELDFFGKNLDRYKAGKLRFLKETQLYKANKIRVASEIAQNYIELKRREKEIENLTEIASLRKELVKIAATKEKNGVITKSQFHQSEINYDSASSVLIEAQGEQKILTYKIAVLLGMMPEKISEILNKSNTSIFHYHLGSIPTGLKSDILKRRPDIIAAEYEINAADFDRSAQFKEFFPSFTLNAKLGGGSKELSNILQDTTNVKDIRGGISVPIFSAGQLIAEYKVSKAKAKAAIINYEKTVLEAVEECESQLVRYNNALQIEANANHSLEASNKILRISQNQKNLGVISTEELIESKIVQLNSENQTAQRKSGSMVNLIALYKALGGGFEGYEMRFEKDRVLWVESNKEVK
jgi:NodT family efflux transporter outer membrane factor (OMF) lipoprotein